MSAVSSVRRLQTDIMKVKCFLVFFVFVSCLKTSISLYCYWNSGCPYKEFSSKTPYNFVRGDIRDSLIHLKGCEPVSIWGLYRHGKRLPSKHYSALMKNALIVQKYVEASYTAGKCSLCAEDVENLIQWQMDTKLFEGDRSISDDGLREMEELAKRLKQAFPQLFGDLEEGNYIFQPSFSQRTKTSMKAFIKGFHDDKLTYLEAKDGYNTHAPYKTCKSYQQELKDQTFYVEANKYHNNPEYLAMKDRIRRRSGIDLILNDDNITAIYDLCRYNSSGYDNKLSPWCALFTSDDLIVLEYETDLGHYYRSGYGQPKAKIFGRMPLTDLLKTFKQAKEGNGKKIVAYCSHASMLDMMYTALDVFKDSEALTGAHRNPGRKWRSTKLSTFSSNLLAVLNRCPENEASEYNVVFYSNEEPLMSICKEGVCTWQEFEQKLTFENTSLDFCDGQIPPSYL